MIQNKVFFVGPLPPPLGGFSAINKQMLGRLMEKSDVCIFDVAPKLLKLSSKWIRFITIFHRMNSILIFLFLVVVRRPVSVYIGLSGGLGQVYDSLYILIARLMGIDIFLHHHSFAYLNEVKFHNKICLKLAAHAHHVVLCDVMARKLASVYCITDERIFTLSNVAFLDQESMLRARNRGDREVVTLGFISNITLEKGIVEFFEVVSCLSKLGHTITGLVAGPVEDSLQEKFSSLLAEHPQVKYLGPVYDEKKDCFFKSVDILLFPTKYKNEAEPVTILEALSYGIPIIAIGRGCIHSMIDERSGVVFPEVEGFVAYASAYIASVIAGAISLDLLSEGAISKFNEMRGCYGEKVDELVLRITGQRKS